MADVEQLSLELAAELATNDAEQTARPFVDPRTIPTRHSLLKQMALSPAHYLEACQQPQDDSLAARLGSFAYDPKEALRVGKAIHALLTGTGRVEMFAGIRRGKKYDAFAAEAAAAGAIEILNQREFDLVMGVVTSVRRHEKAMQLLFDGTIVEQRIDWEFSGKPCRATPDARIAGKYIVDLKSTVSSQPEKFARQARGLFYYAQADLYAEAMERTGVARPGDAYIIAVEKKRPYPVTICRFTEELLELGSRMNRLWIERLKICEAENLWPVYAPPPAVIDLGLPEEDFLRGVEVDGKQLEA